MDLPLVYREIDDAIARSDFVLAKLKLLAVLDFLKKNKVTQYVDYWENQLLLAEILSDKLNEPESACDALRELIHFFRSPPIKINSLTPSGEWAYSQALMRLGHQLIALDKTREAITTFQEARLFFCQIRGAESQEVATVDEVLRQLSVKL